MPPPSSKKEAQSFIGMINYLSKFSPRLTELVEPIRELVKEKFHLTGVQNTRNHLNCSKKRLSEHPFWPTITQEKMMYYKQAQV